MNATGAVLAALLIAAMLAVGTTVDLAGLRRVSGPTARAYYRCRYAQEYALANKTHHPRNIYLRERDLVGPLDTALAGALAVPNQPRPQAAAQHLTST